MCFVDVVTGQDSVAYTASFSSSSTMPIMYGVRIHVERRFVPYTMEYTRSRVRGWKAIQVFVVADSKSACRSLTGPE